MQNLNTLGTLISLISVIVVFVGSLVGIRVRRTSSKYKRQQEVQEKLIQATDWIFQMREWAAARGLLNQLPELPQILRFEYVTAKAEEESATGPYTQLLDQLSTIQKALSPMDAGKIEPPPTESPPKHTS